MSKQRVGPPCGDCAKRSKCTELCREADDYANGNGHMREPLLRDISPTVSAEYTGSEDYNAALGELIEDRRQRAANAVEDITEVPDYRLRLILAGVLVQIPQAEIAKIINITQSRISQLIQQHITRHPNI